MAVAMTLPPIAIRSASAERAYCAARLCRAFRTATAEPHVLRVGREAEEVAAKLSSSLPAYVRAEAWQRAQEMRDFVAANHTGDEAVGVLVAVVRELLVDAPTFCATLDRVVRDAAIEAGVIVRLQGGIPVSEPEHCAAALVVIRSLT